ncbi:MAG: type IX secretion system membrane protein PorP/SprF [Bacteroidales bacterium]|nr:type IX secretion system membrane protein PorP/SprF [Bacteroidales bacterium]
MKPKNLFIGMLLVIISIPVSAQLIPLHDEPVFNPSLINPAQSGIEKGTSFLMTYRNQWTGFTDAPKFVSIGLNSRIKAKGRYNHSGEVIRKSRIPRSGRVGFSIHITNDENAPFTRTGIQAAYAYHIPLDNGALGTLSAGASVSFYQQKLDVTQFSDFQANDPAMANYENLMIPNLGLGIVYQYKKASIGLSGIQLIPLSIDHSGSEFGEKVKSQLYFTAAYLINISKIISYKPAILVTNTPQSISVIQQFHLGRHLEITGIWHTTSSIAVFTGLTISNIRIGYSFDYNYGDLTYYNETSHFLLLGYLF